MAIVGSAVATIGLKTVGSGKDAAPAQESAYIDRSGKVVLKVPFAHAQPFSQGLAAVETQNKIGFIDKTGQLKIAPRFPAYKEPAHANMGLKGCRWFEYNRDIPFYTFSEGLAAVRTPDAVAFLDNRVPWGYIDRTGRMVIPGKFDDVGKFHDGLAPVVISDKVGLIDRSGHTLFLLKATPVYHATGNTAFASGLLPIQTPEMYCGYVDARGKFVIQPKFTYARSFSEGIACVGVGRIYETTSIYGKATQIDTQKHQFIDPAGKTLFSQSFEDANSFSEGLAAVGIGKKYGFIDKTGALVIKPSFDSANQFSNGLARVTAGKQSFYIDRTGKKVVAPQGIDAGDFAEGLAPVSHPEF